MKKFNLKKLISLLAIFAMLVSVMPTAAFAEETGSTQPAASGEIIYINPLYEDVITEDDLVKPEEPEEPSEFDNVPPTVNTALADFETFEAAAADMRADMVQRMETINLEFKVPKDEYSSNTYYDLFTEAIVHTGKPKEGDALRWVYAGWHCSYSSTYDSTYYYLDITYTMTYYTTIEQEAELDAAVDTLLNSTLDLDGKTDFEKLSELYDYVCSHVTYDYANLDDKSYTLKYTAYAAMINGTSVCQGYALLMYRLLLEEGINCRFIASKDHGWNIVQMPNGLYYDIDATWDAGKTTYGYYLQCESNFTRNDTHPRLDEYKTDAFNEEYPMGDTDFPCLTAHIYGDGVVTTAATCTTAGVETYTCENCKGTYTEAIAANGEHSYDGGVVTTAATCTTAGVKTYTCTGCGDTYTEAIPATGEHSYDGGVVTTAATCMKAGVKTYTCTGCGDTYTESIKATGHSYNSGVVTTAATCTTAGIKTYTCSVCGYSYTTTIDALGHNYVNGKCTRCSADDPSYQTGAKVPTCTVSAAQGTASRKIKITGKLNDYANLADYNITGHGILYITASRLGSKELTVNTSGRTKVTFGAYNGDGSFSYTFRATATSTKYVARTWISYTDGSGNTVIVYSDPITVSYNSLG